MQGLRTQEWSRQTEAILHNARQVLLESKSPQVQSLADQLPETNTSEEEHPISLAFAGQYSSGKSTILKVLTGRYDIATGPGITTQQTYHFDWDGIQVIDTPGIHTSLRPDHDTITYEAISKADLLVFVITNELFDSHLADHFRALTIDRGKGHETILVVNKMGRSGDGNTAESRKTAAEDLRKVISPFSPEDLLLTFTDAESALEAKQEQETDLAEMLEEQANISELIENLNGLVQQKGLNARHTTALYAIDQTLQDGMAAEPTGDPDGDALFIIYNQNIRAMRETRSQLQQSVQNAIDQTIIEVKLAGANYAETFYPGATQEQIDKATETIDARFQSLWETLVRQLDEEFAEIMTGMGARIQEMHDSHRFQSILDNLSRRASGTGGTKLLEITQKTATELGGLSAKYSINASRTMSGATRLGRFSGSATHSTVLRVGHMFGHSFRPWEAVKLARGIGTASQVLAVAGIALGVILQVKTDQDEAKQDWEYLEKRRDIRAQFDREAQQIQVEATSTTREFINENLTIPMEQMQGYADELNSARQDQNQHLEQLTAISNEARDLIKLIHNEG